MTSETANTPQSPHSSYSIGSNPDRLLDVVLAFNSEVDYVSLLNIILTKMMEITYSDAGTLYIISEGKLHFRILKNNTFQMSKIAGPEDEIALPPIVLNEKNIENVSAYCAIHNEAIIIEDVYEDNRFNFSGPRNYDEMTGYRTRSMLVIPLSTVYDGETEVLGVIQLLNTTNPDTGQPFSYEDIYDPDIIIPLAKIASNTLANLTRIREIHEVFNSFVGVMTQAVDERSQTTKYHTQNVSNYCEAFTKYLSYTFPEDHPLHFSERHKDRLAMAALLHDIGKIATPTHILDKAEKLIDTQLKEIKYRFEIKKHQLHVDLLTGCLTGDNYDEHMAELEFAIDLIEQVNKSSFLSDKDYERINRLASITYADPQGKIIPILTEEDLATLTIRKGTLTPDEWVLMRDHVSATGRLLDRMTFWKYYKGVPKWARDHHEFLDGTGYPNGLRGNDIAVETRIITIMDIFDALTATDRPYRTGMSPDKAVAILKDMAKEGKLNRELVDIFAESRLWEGLMTQ